MAYTHESKISRAYRNKEAKAEALANALAEWRKTGGVTLSRKEGTYWVGERDAWGMLVASEPFKCIDRAKAHARQRREANIRRGVPSSGMAAPYRQGADTSLPHFGHQS